MALWVRELIAQASDHWSQNLAHTKKASTVGGRDRRVSGTYWLVVYRFRSNRKTCLKGLTWSDVVEQPKAFMCRYTGRCNCIHVLILSLPPLLSHMHTYAKIVSDKIINQFENVQHLSQVLSWLWFTATGSSYLAVLSWPTLIIHNEEKNSWAYTGLWIQQITQHVQFINCYTQMVAIQ